MSQSVGTQMRGWDAATFRTAAGDPGMRSTVVALSILDRTPSWERLRTRIERLTRVVPVLRMRALYGALGVDLPRLAVDPDFDLDVHLRRYRMADGAGWQDLLDDARRMSLLDFDRDRPLWEMALVEGLPGGRAALLMKLHHSIADGQATVQIGLNLFEFSEEGDPDESPGPPAPTAEDVRARDVTYANLADNIRRGAELAVATMRGVVDLTRGSVTDAATTWASAMRTIGSIGRYTEVPEGPLSPIMAGRGTTYRFGAFAVPFSALRDVSRAEGKSVNDAFIAAVAAGMDAYHLRHGVVVDELRVNVPISTRGDAGDRTGTNANAVSIARFTIPIAGLSDLERMEVAHDRVAQWKAEPAIHLTDPLAEVSWFVPVPMLAQAARASDLTTSNVPGPPIPMFVGGSRMVACYPLVATIGAAVSITMVTYDGTAYVGVSSDDRAVGDLADLLADLRAGFAQVTGVEPVGLEGGSADTPDMADSGDIVDRD